MGKRAAIAGSEYIGVAGGEALVRRDAVVEFEPSLPGQADIRRGANSRNDCVGPDRLTSRDMRRSEWVP